jgi:hypothetical protein
MDRPVLGVSTTTNSSTTNPINLFASIAPGNWVFEFLCRLVEEPVHPSNFPRLCS